MKRKYLDRNIITCTEAVCLAHVKYIDSDIKGYVSHINIVDVTSPGIIISDGAELCIADKGYERLIYLPDDQNWCLTVMFDDKRKIIEWYVDITKDNFIDENGTPCYDDLYLDIVLLPDGQIMVLDEDELLEAKEQKHITEADYDLAYHAYNKLLTGGILNRAYLSSLCDRLFLLFDINN